MRALAVALAALTLGAAATAVAAQTPGGPARGSPDTAPTSAPNAAPAPAAPAPLPPVTATDRFIGRADAPVTVVQYASFVCSHCAEWHTDVLPEFKTRFVDTGKVRLVYRDLPTEPVRVAAIAAGIARCAVPDRYFDVADSLMNGQAQLAQSQQVQPWVDAAIAASGKTRPEIEACLADPATLSGIQASRNDALAAGALGTPSFFVDGKLITGYSIEALDTEIERQLALTP